MVDTFLKIPKIFFEENSKYINLSSNAKIIYALFLTRYNLSVKSYKSNNHSFYDHQREKCFIYYSVDEIIKNSGIKSNKTVIKNKTELEEVGLIEQERTKDGVKIFINPPDSTKENNINFKDMYNVIPGDVTSERLVNLINKNGITDIDRDEFIYIRDIINQYEVNNTIRNFERFVYKQREQYKKEVAYKANVSENNQIESILSYDWYDN